MLLLREGTESLLPYRICRQLKRDEVGRLKVGNEHSDVQRRAPERLVGRRSAFNRLRNDGRWPVTACFRCFGQQVLGSPILVVGYLEVDAELVVDSESDFQVAIEWSHPVVASGRWLRLARAGFLPYGRPSGSWANARC